MNYTIKTLIVIAAVLAVVTVISLTVVITLASSFEVEEQYSDVLNAYSRELGLNNTLLTLQEWGDGSISLMLGDEKMAGFTNAGALNYSKNNLTTVLDQIKTWDAMLTQ